MGVCGAKTKGAKENPKDKAGEGELNPDGTTKNPDGKKGERKGILKDPKNPESRDGKEKPEGGNKPHFEGIDPDPSNPDQNPKELVLKEVDNNKQQDKTKVQSSSELNPKNDKKANLQLPLLEEDKEKQEMTPKISKEDELRKKKQAAALDEINREMIEEDVHFGQMKDQNVIVVTDNVKISVK